MYKVLLVGLAVIFLTGCTAASNAPFVSSDSEIQDSAQKPGKWPADIATPANAYQFAYGKYGTSEMMGYKVPYTRGLTTLAMEIIDLLTPSGWLSLTESAIVSDNAAIYTLRKSTQTLVLTVSNLDSQANEYTTVSLSLGTEAQ